MAQSIRLNRREIADLLAGPAGPVAADLRRRAENVRKEARRLAPVQNGTLKNSISWEMRIEGGSLVARVGTNIEYALAVHQGTQAYTLRPRNRQALAFSRWPNAPAGARRSKQGRYVYKSVRIPARAGRPFLADALRAARL
jgi:phage gpG-like protein